MLYIVATPIGNLKDVTYRAIQILKECDYVLCEDTRKSHVLFSHYHIKKTLHSFHKFNEKEKLHKVLSDLEQGKEIALISDAGTPGICDPGAKLIRLCHERGLPLTSIPGPNAVITALSLSGFESEAFQFIGFFPKKEGELKKKLLEMFLYPYISIAFITPHNVIKILEMIHTHTPKSHLILAKELTKMHETILQGSAKELLTKLQSFPLKGEFVLLFNGKKEPLYTDLSPQKLCHFLEREFTISRKEAMKMAAELKGIQKKEIYRSFLHDEK